MISVIDFFFFAYAGQEMYTQFFSFEGGLRPDGTSILSTPHLGSISSSGGSSTSGMRRQERTVVDALNVEARRVAWLFGVLKNCKNRGSGCRRGCSDPKRRRMAKIEKGLEAAIMASCRGDALSVYITMFAVS